MPQQNKTGYSAIQVCNVSSGEKSEVQGHPPLQSEFGVQSYLYNTLSHKIKRLGDGLVSKVFVVQA